MKEKKAWQQPELVVLVRNKPEEAVLIMCKDSGAGSGQDSQNGGCWIMGCQPSCDAFNPS